VELQDEQLDPDSVEIADARRCRSDRRDRPPAPSLLPTRGDFAIASIITAFGSVLRFSIARSDASRARRLRCSLVCRPGCEDHMCRTTGYAQSL